MFYLGDSVRLPGSRTASKVLMVCFVLGYLVSAKDLAFWSQQGGVIPDQWFHPEKYGGMAHPVIKLFWSLFIHADWKHLFWNGLFFYLAAGNVEAKLGSKRFLVFFAACGSAGALLHALVMPSTTTPVIGASGAISGLLGAYWIWFRDHMLRIRWRYKRKTYDYMAPILSLLMLWLAGQILVGLPSMLASKQPVAYLAHLGGFGCGFFLALLSTKRPKKPKFKTYDGGKIASD